MLLCILPMLAGDSPFAGLYPDPCKKITGTYHIYFLGGDQILHFVPSPLLKSKVYIINETTKKKFANNFFKYFKQKFA